MSATAPELERRVEDAGIHTLSIQTPFGVGPINAFLLEGSPLTLVDNGPNQATALREIDRLLGEHGRRIEELELLLITHPHVDHCALTQAIADRSGAEVAVLDSAVETTETYPREHELDDEYAAELMLRHGVAPDVMQALRAMAALVRGYGAPAKVTRPLAEGEVVEAGSRRLQVLFRPGHSPWDTLFLDAEDGILFSGDHLLPDISSNALVTRPSSPADGDRSRPLLAYRRSLEATRELDARVVLSGHGPAFGGHRQLIDDRLRKQEARAATIFDLLEQSPMSAHEIARALWGPIAIEQAYLTMSEVLGHLDLLLADGSVRELETDLVRFARSST